MKRKFVIDKEIILSDNDDFLKTKIYSDNLTKLINNTEQDRVFTIGLFGGWGTGKSSIIETSKMSFEKNFKQKRIKFITYDAWQYANDSFRRMFLLKIQQELKLEQTEEMSRFYSSENKEAEPKYIFSKKGIIVFLSLLIILDFIIFLLPLGELNVTFASIITLVGLIITAISGLFQTLKINITKPQLFAPEQFEDCFKQMIAYSLKGYTWVQIIIYTIFNDKTVRNLDKIVIVIDNIDRCHNQMAYNLLTDIKTFLSNEPYNIIFIIPVDDEALRKHLFNSTQNSIDSCHKEKEEFLRKFFNVSIRIKPYGSIEMFALAENINRKYSLNYNNETLNLLSKEYARNPRRIIQLFNNLSAEFNNYDDAFAIQNETLICAVQIIKEEYFQFYEKLIKDKNLLLGDEAIPADLYKEETEQKAELVDFIRVIKHITSKTSFSTLGRILTNKDSIFDSIPSEIQKSIATIDSAKIIEYLRNKPEQTDIIFSFIESKIDEVIKYKINSEIQNYFYLIAKINIAIEINQPNNKKIISRIVDYSDIIKNCLNYNTLCQFANILSNQNETLLKKEIINYLKNNSSKEFDDWNNLKNSALTIFNNESDSIELSDFFTEFHKTNYIDYEFQFSEEQLTNLLTDNLVTNTIEQLTQFTLEEEYSEELLWLFKNKPNISNSSYSEFFLKLIELIDDINEKTKDEIIELISFVNEFANTISNKSLTTELDEICSKLLNDRSKVNSTISSRITNISLFDECDKENDLKQIIDLIFNKIRVSGNCSIVDKHLHILFNDESKRIIINSKLIELIDVDVNLDSIIGDILNDNNYSSDDTIDLLDYCFGKISQDFSLIDENVLIEKLSSILNNLNQSNKLEILLNKHTKSSKIKQILIDEIVVKESEFINNLPSTLLKLAIDTFNSKTADLYSRNISFLKIIATNGKQSQKSALIKLLCRELHKNEDIESIIEIFKLLTDNIYSTDKSLIISNLRSYLDSEENTDENFKNQISSYLKFIDPPKGQFFKKKKK